MDDRERSDAPTAVERPRGSEPSAPSSAGVTQPDREPSKIPTQASASAFDPPRDRFETVAELGRGGMGRVDEVHDRALGRAVAIKHMLHPTGTELARFEREVRITARLEHPGIVPVHDAGRTPDGTPYYVMRRIDGKPLAELAAKKTLAERLALVPNLLAACDAAAYAHARGVVHRDIKPTNILIGPFGETLLIDWGLAREMNATAAPEAVVLPSEPDLTRAGTVAGTPGFMSPEQARGESVDARADVFALGVTLFFTLSGKLPWATSSATEMIAAVGSGRSPDWSQIPADVPVDLRAVLEKAMAADAAERYPDASALAADLRSFITGNLVGAYEYGAIARFTRFIRRHRAAAAVALVSLVIVGIVAAISIRRVVAERDDANAARALAERRQREASDMADSLLVDSARQLADTNPIAAITKLRQLSPTSKRWRDAWAAATTAWFNGIPFGFLGEPGHANVEISADSHTALVASTETGQITILDLLTRVRRPVARIGRVFHCTWFEAATTIMCTQEDKVSLVDVATGAVREYPIDAVTIHSNRSSRVLVHTTDHRVLEMRAGSRELTELMTGVDDISVSSDLEWIVVTRGRGSMLVHDNRSWPIPWDNKDQRSTPVFNIGSGLVTMIEWDTIRVLAVVQNELVEKARTPRTGLILTTAAVDGNSYIITADGLDIVEPLGRTTVRRLSVRSVFFTPTGFIVSGHDGELVLRDTDGFFTLGPRPVNYRAMDGSPDQRFVLAVLDNGDLLAWDLEGPRGHSLTIDTSENPSHITKTDLWTFEESTGLIRRPLPGGTRQVQIAVDAPGAGARFDRVGRWFSTSNRGRDTRIYDIATQQGYEIDPTTPISADENGLAYAVDRTVWTWRPATNQPPKQVMQFPLRPAFIAFTSRYIIGLAGTRELMRYAFDTKELDRAVVDVEVDRFVIEDNGRAWLLGKGQIWRWDLHGTPIAVATPEPIVDIEALGIGVLLRSSKTLTLADGDEQRFISADSSLYRMMTDELIAVQASTQVVNVVDLVTARTIKLPLRAAGSMGQLVASGNRVGTVTAVRPDRQFRFTYWDLLVPRDAPSLQKWLATITNAMPIPGSDAVAWPKD